MLAGDREVKLVLVEPGGQQDRDEALILDRKPHEVVVPRHAPIARPGLALDLNDRPRLQEIRGKILAPLAGARISSAKAASPRQKTPARMHPKMLRLIVLPPYRFVLTRHMIILTLCLDEVKRRTKAQGQPELRYEVG